MERETAAVVRTIIEQVDLRFLNTILLVMCMKFCDIYHDLNLPGCIQREYARKKAAAGYTDLKSVQEDAANQAAAKRKEFAMKLRENKLKIQNKLKTRPSLIERYEQVHCACIFLFALRSGYLLNLSASFCIILQDMAKTQAHISAVQKIATNAIPARDEFDDLFDVKEKFLVTK